MDFVKVRHLAGMVEKHADNIWAAAGDTRQPQNRMCVPDEA